MTRNDPFVRLRHMLDYSLEAISMAGGKTPAEIEGNRQLALALTHLVELIGEAASKVPEDLQVQLPNIPWPKIISMRNRLIHGYDYVDYSILLDTIAQDLPSLVAELERIIPPEKS